MKLTNRSGMGRRVLGAMMLAVLASCGGGGDGDQSPKLRISRIVSFGDSLSDVGSYNTTNLAATVSQRAGQNAAVTTNSGKFTVNSANAKNWIELLAAQYGVAAPCPAQTGLTPAGDANSNPLFGIGEAPEEHAECFAYGQGGARVTNPVGPGNRNLPGNEGLVGQLTTPLVTQVARHLAKNTGGAGLFASDELVLVLAGGNDLFINAALVGAAQITPEQAVAAMATAGTELANLVKNEMVAKGAAHVVVVTLPDVSLTPSFVNNDATRPLALALSQAFNGALTAGLANAGSAVLIVDAFTQSQEQARNKAQFDLVDVETPVCNLAGVNVMLFPSALVCNENTLITSDKDRSKFLYADGVHPTPYGYKLLAQFVADRLVKAGLL